MYSNWWQIESDLSFTFNQLHIFFSFKQIKWRKKCLFFFPRRSNVEKNEEKEERILISCCCKTITTCEWECVFTFAVQSFPNNRLFMNCLCFCYCKGNIKYTTNLCAIFLSVLKFNDTLISMKQFKLLQTLIKL